MSGGARPESASRAMALVAIGAACALWLFPVLAGPRVQQLRLERDGARAEVEALRNEISHLRKISAEGRGAPLVKRVSAVVDGPDRRVTLEAEQLLKRELAAHVGRAVEEVSPVLIYSRLHGRLLTIDGIDYTMEIRLLTLSTDLRAYAVLRPIQELKNKE